MAMFDKRRDDSTPAERAGDAGLPSPSPRRRLPEAASASRGTATIGKTITIRGDVTGDQGLVIEGKVDGTIRNSDDLTIGQSGHVEGDVKANTVTIEGEVSGDITGARKVAITKTGRVLGNLVAPRVTLDEGAKFKGRIDMDPGPAQLPTAIPRADGGAG